MKLPQVIDILLYNDSRKVGFGLWLQLLSTYLLMKGFVNSEQWILCTMSSSVMVGGGTLADRWMKGKEIEKASSVEDKK